MDLREGRALLIAATTKLEPVDGRWEVPSQSGNGSYTVIVEDEDNWSCTCPDYEEHLSHCKHIRAVEITMKREADGRGELFSPLERPRYPRDWSAYNNAQVHEKQLLLPLLAELCGCVEPWPTGRPGRPRAPLGDIAFAIALRAYTGIAARRFSSDLKFAADAGHIDTVPSFNTVLRYTREPELTGVLRQLVAASSLPLAEIESNFAVDSSGFATSQKDSWLDLKHNRVQERRLWVKAHICVGTDTHIVTAVDVTAYAANDAPRLPPLLKTTAENFRIERVTADLGYSSKANAQAVEALGGTPYIPFKSNAVLPPEGTAWARMYHQFMAHREEFMVHYHQRSNVETVFSMIKRKFGDTVFGKSPEAQINEVLGKVIIHNLCVLIQGFFEVGLDIELGGPNAKILPLRPKARV